MKISIIINCHNSEAYIEQSISSILNQTYKSFELIIFDNYSTDNTKKIAKSFKDSRVKYFKTDKKYHLGKARELATKKVQNNWISFLDSDDLWLPTKLFEQAEYIKRKKNIGLVYTDFSYIDKNSTDLKKKSYTKFYKTFVLKKLIKKNYVCFSSIIFNKKIIKTNHIFNPILKNSEDYDLLLKIAQTSSIGSINKKLVKYRIHENNLTKFQIKRSFSEWQYLVYKYSKNHLKEKKKIKTRYKLEKLKKKLFKLFKLCKFIKNGFF